MVTNDINFIQKSIQHHLEDLHVLFTHNMLNIDMDFLNEVNMALLAAQDALVIAVDNNDKRFKAHEEKHGNPYLQ